jgi:hypothetical protein
MKTIFQFLLFFIGLNSTAQSINNCCINPGLINPTTMCPEIWDPVIGCDGIEYSNSCVAQAAGITSWVNQLGNSTTIDWDCGVICTSWTGVDIFELGDWVNPNDPCDLGACLPNGEFVGIAIDCAPLGCDDPWCLPCEGEVVYLDDQCCPVCVENTPLCFSPTGAGIYESGEWANPDDPCDFGYCNEDGFFPGVMIDCPEWMGLPCDGEWILEDGSCCAICVENTVPDCGGISITINNGWNMIGFSCSENTDAIEAFSSIQDKIVIAKDAAGNAYLPSFNFNGIGDLERGYGYLLKVTEEINNYNICENEQDNPDDGSCEDAQDGYDCQGNPLIYVGGQAHGGIVFYIDETGEHGLVAAQEDLDGSYEWGCVGTDINGNNSSLSPELKAIGAGLENTLEIVSGCSETPIAASEALAYESEGYSDWYWPSEYELVEMFNTLGSGGLDGNIGGFQNSWYWSSSEENSGWAWLVNSSDGSASSAFKTGSFRVRAIRAF